MLTFSCFKEIAHEVLQALVEVAGARDTANGIRRRITV